MAYHCKKGFNLAASHQNMKSDSYCTFSSQTFKACLVAGSSNQNTKMHWLQFKCCKEPQANISQRYLPLQNIYSCYKPPYCDDYGGPNQFVEGLFGRLVSTFSPVTHQPAPCLAKWRLLVLVHRLCNIPVISCHRHVWTVCPATGLHLEADCISHLNHHQQWACHSRSLIASECLSTPKNVFMGGMFLEVLMAIKAEGKR